MCYFSFSCQINYGQSPAVKVTYFLKILKIENYSMLCMSLTFCKVSNAKILSYGSAFDFEMILFPNLYHKQITIDCQ